ncbi:hypothetical protein [Sphingobacterium sp. HMA12]|uniref:hypothetical protein n=1 Tax=Sphingobacterium sp. HMA12 TaxID=2050894 RepID=UPI0013159D57|nr:hypothetical protein [Sphingobacterium sp. HMA12]
MKTLKSKIFTGVTVFILLFGVFFMVKAKEKTNSPSAPTLVKASTWHFTGTDQSQIYNASYWQSGVSSNPDCSDDAETLPCTFTVTDATISNTTQLVSYLNTKYPSNPNAVASNADSRKPEM